MPGIPENYIQIRVKGKIVFVSSVLSTDSTSLEVLKQNAEENLEKLITSYHVSIERLEKRCEKLEEEIKKIKGEE